MGKCDPVDIFEISNVRCLNGGPKEGLIGAQKGAAQEEGSKDRPQASQKGGTQGTQGRSQVECQGEGITRGTTKPGLHTSNIKIFNSDI